MNELILVGGGGHCRSVIDVVESANHFRIYGIIDAQAGQSRKVIGYPIIGTDEDLERYFNLGFRFLVAIGQIRTPDPRIMAFNRLHALGLDLATMISPNAYVSKRASIQAGTVVLHGAVVNAQATVGDNCIVNSLALIEHDAQIGAHCHISTGVRVNGGVKVEMGTFIGSGSIIHEGVHIGERCVISAGSVIKSDVPAGSIVRSVR